MKFTIPAKTLSDALARARTVTPSRALIPIMGNVLLECGENLKVIAANPEARLEQVLEAKIKTGGSTTLPLEQLAMSLKHFPGDVTCETDSKHGATFSGGKLRLRLNGLDAKEFPVSNSMEDNAAVGLDLSFPEFRKCLNRVAPFIAVPAQGRPSLEGVMVESENDVLCVVAADGRRMAIAQMGGKIGAFRATIPTAAVRVILGLDAGAPFALWVSKSSVELRTCDWTFRALLLAQEYANWRQLQEIAQQKMKCDIRFDRAAALRAMGFASVTMDDQRRLFVVAGSEDVSFATNGNAAGDSAAVVERLNRNGEHKFIVDPIFFRHALEACEGTEVSVQRPDNTGPLVVAEPNFVSITMPKRLGPPE